MKVWKPFTICVLLAAPIGSSAIATQAEGAGGAQDALPVLRLSEGAVFPVGEENVANAAHFSGKSYVAWLGAGNARLANVTFLDGAHTDWHVHHKTCQILLAASGEGRHQIWGEAVKAMRPGDVLTIPAETKHWHGAAVGKDFQHIAVMEANVGASTE